MPSSFSSERLHIRAPKLEDAPALNDAILETWDQLHRWMPWALQRPSLEDSEAVCSRMALNWAELKDFPLFCFDKETDRFMLASGCHTRNPDIPIFEIGYWCRASEQGRGFVKEAVLAITRVAFEELDARRVEIRCDADNLPSAAVAKACGYSFDARLVNERRNNLGQLANTLIFSQVR